MLVAILSLPVSSYAFGSNPPLPNTSAPGQGTCASCHGTLTAGSGVIVTAPKSYTPGGAAVPMTVTIPTRGGFELEVVTQTSNVQAGVLAAGDANGGVSTVGGIQFFYSTGETTSWSFSWTPPTTNVGSVELYVTGGTNGQNYSNNFVVTPAAAAAPSISSFVAGSSSITAGNSTTLTGSFSNGTGVVDNGVGSVTSGTAVTVMPTVTTTYTLTVSGTGTPATAKVTVTVTATAPAPNFSLSSSPSSVTVAPGSNGSTTLTITPTGGFNASTVNFSPPGLPSGLSATFGAISSTGTSKLTISATSSAAAMTVGVTITGTSGSLSNSTVVSLTVSGSTGSSALTAAPTALSFKYAGGSMPSSQKLMVTDASGTVPFSASASGGSWLSVSPGSGTTSGAVMVSANPSRMSAGTYTGAIQLSATGATGASVPVTLTITSSTCSDDCGGGGGGGGSTGSMTAQPYVYDPNSSGTVTAVWVDRLGMPTSNQSSNSHDPGLVLSKNGGAPNGTLAGATIRNYTGSLTELGFDYRVGGQCTATSPRFIVVTTDNITHSVGGCSKGTITAAPMAGWNRVRFNLAETSQTNPAITPGETVSSILLVLDVGPEAGTTAAGGLVVIDNIYINNTYAVPGGTTRSSGDN